MEPRFIAAIQRQRGGGAPPPVQPVVTSIVPDTGTVGTPYTIHGSGFSGAGATVAFGPEGGGDIVVVNDTTITGTIPAIDPNTYPVIVTAGDLSSDDNGVTITVL